MNDASELSAAFDPLEHILREVALWVPGLIAGLVTVVAGIALAVAVRWLTMWLVDRTGIGALAERAGVARVLYDFGWHGGLRRLLGNALAIAILVGTIAATAEVAGLPGVAEALGTVVGLVPRFLTAGAFLILGHITADLARNLVSNMGGADARLERSTLVADGAYYLLLLVSGALAAEHLGLQTQLVNNLILVIAGSSMISVGVGFALGSRDTFRDLVARHYAERLFPPGTELEVGELVGVVRRYAPRTVIIENSDGEHYLACSTLLMSVKMVQRGVA